MKIKSAEFVISNSDYQLCPQENYPEYALIGRSNVGKSSIINALTQRKNLAKTSGKPGKTQLINHFIINKRFASNGPNGRSPPGKTAGRRGPVGGGRSAGAGGRGWRYALPTATHRRIAPNDELFTPTTHLPSKPR